MLIPEQMAPKDWTISDLLPKLSQAGFIFEDVQVLREQRLKTQEQIEKMTAATDYVFKNKRDLADLRVILAPIEYQEVMLEAAQFPTKIDYDNAAKKYQSIELKPVLILYHPLEQREKIVRIEYAGPANRREGLAALVAEPHWSTDFTIQLEGEPPRRCLFRAESQHPQADVDHLVSRLLSLTLHAGRPLRYYHCTFYLPLDLFLEADLTKPVSAFKLFSPDPEKTEPHHLDIEQTVLSDKEEEVDTPKGCEKQAYLYFLPHLRDVIFKTQKSNPAGLAVQPIEHYRLRQVDGMTLSLNDKAAIVTVQFTDVSVYRYFNNLYLLAISVKPTVDLGESSSLNHDDHRWWHDLFFADAETFKKIEQLQIYHWLTFTYQARIVYPSFVEQNVEGKITPMTLKMGKQTIEFQRQNTFSPIILSLLQFFFQKSLLTKERLQYLPDDRMISSPAYGLAGTSPKTAHEHEAVKRLFSLALYVDRIADGFKDLDGYAYDPEFIQQLLRQDSLTRWQALGTYEGFCRYANVYLGFGWFFNRVIAPSHVPYVYGRMLILALCYQMTLRHYNRRISHATQQLFQHNKTKEFKALRKDFIQFTNNYWFHEVTNQIQGVEVFELQTKGLGLEKEYQFIKDEMERADEYSTILRTERFSWGAGAVATAALVTSLLALPLNEMQADWLQLIKDYAFTLSFMVTTVVVGYLLLLSRK